MADSNITTSVPPMTFSANGIVAPDLADVLTGIQSDQKTALGSDLSTDLTSPQGQIAMTQAAIIGDKNDQLLAMSNMINPDYSAGRWQDGIGKIYFLERKAAAGTKVTATCGGLANTLIPAGSQAQDTNGYIYTSDSDAIIGSSGTVNVVFTNTTLGAIECAAGALNSIYVAVSGWSEITNVSAGVLGRATETRAAFEYRRRLSVANNAQHTDGALLGILLALDGVTDAYVYSNNTAVEKTLGSTEVVLPTGTAYIAVYGGNSSEIAAAIHSKINPSCATQCPASTTNQTIYDTTNYTSNYPAYQYFWTVPTVLPIHFKVTIENNSYLPNTITSDVQAAILNAFNGEDGGTVARIGSRLTSGRYYGGVQAIDQQNVIITSILISNDNTTWVNALEIGVNQMPTLESANIAVVLS